MKISKNTSKRSYYGLLIKVALILIIVLSTIVLLGKIEFPSPNKDIKKIIPNDKIKIVK